MAIQPKTALKYAEKLREFVNDIQRECDIDKFTCLDCKYYDKEIPYPKYPNICDHTFNKKPLTLTAIIHDLGGSDEKD